MKLAEALHLRADLQKRIAQLGDRLKNNARVQEGDVPAEDPIQLLYELERESAELARLITAINLTNSQTESDGQTLTAMIAQKDALSQRISIMRSFLQEASAKVDRYSAKEIRVCSTVDIRAQMSEVDRLSRALRELDVKIQGLNWTVDLIE